VNVRWIGPVVAAVVLVAFGVVGVAHAAAAGWTGTFEGFPSADWQGRWGVAAGGRWGFDTMRASGPTLDVTYGKGSSAPSCTNCPTVGGGQFFTDLRQLGRPDLGDSRTVALRYTLRFPVGYDFGKGGKLPGLYGGPIGDQSGGNHGKAWSTRYMWRGGDKGEVYFYAPDGDGYGKDLGLGRWHFAADGKDHTIEQLVDRDKQTISVWYDGRAVFTGSVPGIRAIPVAGVFFSTFFGGHDTSWGPKRTVDAYFGDFALGTARS
jgi:hypothetical protein